jgi:hypothetical protein
VTTVLVAGALANKPGNAGAAWTRISWACGLRELGFDVHLVEQVGFLDAAGKAWFGRVTDAVDLPATLVGGDGSTFGLPARDLEALAAEAVLLVNISGHLVLPWVRERVRTQVYVDLDPGFVQWWEAQGVAGARLAGHDAYFTVGLNVGRADCPVPTNGLPWRPILQPVVLDHWPVVPPSSRDRFTTVGTWRGPYGPVAADGTAYGVKAHEFRVLAGLPRRNPEAEFEAALDIHPADAADRARLEAGGWRVVAPEQVAGDLDAFRRYVQGSAAELSAAQGVYVQARTGWFSDRSARYLASGRPVLVQDTGIGEHLPVGEGLVTFRTVEEAAAAVEAVTADYERHAKAARLFAEEHLAAPVVLGRLCEEVGVAP